MDFVRDLFSENTLYCPTCGTHNDDNNFRCVQCGNILQQMPTGYGGAGYGGQEVFAEPSSATTAIILAVVAWAACGIFLSIPAMVVARKEIRGIEEGRRDPRHLSTAKAAFWLSVVNVGLTVVVVIFYIILFATLGLDGAL